jgi:ribose transport system permease protein
VLDRFDVRPRNWAALIDWLSCGNQQKVFVGRWLETGAQLFIMEEPTAGVDIGTKGVIHRMLCDLAAEGAGVLVVSSDFEEAVTLCDRALVVGRGVITGADTGKLANPIVDGGGAGCAGTLAGEGYVRLNAPAQRPSAVGSTRVERNRVESPRELRLVICFSADHAGLWPPSAIELFSTPRTSMRSRQPISDAHTGPCAHGAARNEQFDLSIGYHLGMAQVLIVGLQVTQGLGWPLAAVLILLASLVAGFVNSLLVTFFRIDSFIATMGTGMLLYGVTNWYMNGEQIVGMSLPDSFTSLTQIVRGAPLPTVHVAIIAVALWIVTERLPVGRNLYVIGANVRAAELTGINVRRHVMGAFVTAGLLSSFAGIVLGSILQTGTPSVGPEYLLPAFAGSLLGATSIKPGRVNVIGSLLSVLVLAFSFSGVQQLGAPFYVPFFFNGPILIVAVGLSVYAARRRQRAATAAKPGTS